MIENFRIVKNDKTVIRAAINFRPSTYALGGANVVHDVEGILYGVEAYGPGGNAFEMESVTRWVVKDCIGKYCGRDGINSHSLYTYPANSTSVNEGIAQHTFIDGGVYEQFGPNAFRSQPTASTSANAVTDHDRGRTTAINVRGGLTNGSTFALVGGAKALALNCNMYSPNYVTPATMIHQACYLSHGNAIGAASDPTELWTIGCEASVRPTGVAYYSGGIGQIVAVAPRGLTSSLVENTGYIHDENGDNL